MPAGAFELNLHALYGAVGAFLYLVMAIAFLNPCFMKYIFVLRCFPTSSQISYFLLHDVRQLPLTGRIHDKLDPEAVIDWNPRHGLYFVNFI